LQSPIVQPPFPSLTSLNQIKDIHQIRDNPSIQRPNKRFGGLHQQLYCISTWLHRKNSD